MHDSDALPFGHGGPPARGTLRAAADDFQVDEDLGFEPSGSGEHVLLQVRKRGENTERVAKAIGRLAGVRPVAVGFAGLKDRNAVSRQWFSVHLPGQAEPDWSALNSEQVEVMAAERHHRKLRRGALRGNRFVLTVRSVAGEVEAVDRRLRQIQDQGVPAYFGVQRFGRDGDNVAQAVAMFGGKRVSRHQRGLLLSAARSELFNKVLAERVRRKAWNQLLPGDVAMLDGSHSVFPAASVDPALQERCARLDVHPTGPLWGRGELPTAGEVLALENQVLAEHQVLRQGLETAGLEQQRRALRHPVRELHWQWLDDETLQLRFFLDRGNYATSVMREVLLDCPIGEGRATDA